MKALQLDGAVLDMDGREFTYKLPAPFGPKRGPAYLMITARPASATNVPFRKALDELLHAIKVRERRSNDMLAADGDTDAWATRDAEDAKWIIRSAAEIRIDHCVISWDTDIQNNGKALEATRDNFLALSEFEHPEIVRVFKKMQRDIGDFDKFFENVEEAELEVSEKN